MLERDVRFQRSRSELACLFPVFRRLPGLSEDHASAGRRPAFHFQGHVLEGDHLLVADERTPQSLGWRDNEEVGLEPGVLDRDTLPFRSEERRVGKECRSEGGAEYVIV